MNREIKFRGLMTTGEWVYGLPLEYLKNSTAYYNECSYRICWNPETGGQSNAPVKNGTICQFTGLKDKNGVDIYEGDVINEKIFIDCDKSESTIISNGIHQKYIAVPHVVTFDKVTTGYKLVSEEYNKQTPFWAAHKRVPSFEIIGNIHQNPDLL